MNPDEPNEDGLIPVAPLDEDEERRRREAMHEDLQTNHDLLAAMTRRPIVPLEHRDDLTTADLEHFVINYCLDAFDGRSERAFQNALQLRRFGSLGMRTVEEFIAGKQDPALKHIPSQRLAKLLRTLQADLRAE
jgi:hypothetical protein